MKTPPAVQRFGPLAARVLIAQLFVISGFGKAMAFAKTAAFIANRGLPLPEVMLVATIALELGCGMLLVAGWKARGAAAALFAFTLIATLVFHAFWAVEPHLAKDELNNFMKNLAIMGGLLYIAAYGPGPLSWGRTEPAVSPPAPGRKRKSPRSSD